MKKMTPHVREIATRLKDSRVGIRDVLSIIHMTLEGFSMKSASLFSRKVFEELDELIARSVHGTRIEPSRAERGHAAFSHF